MQGNQQSKLVALVTLALSLIATLPAFAWDFHLNRHESLTGDSRLNREISRERSYQRNPQKRRFICEQNRLQRQISRTGHR